MGSDLKAASFDDNVWYLLSESRVDNYAETDWISSLSINVDGTLWVGPATTQYWQFQPVGDKPGRYAMRCSLTGVFKQMGVCFVPDEIADGKTEPCMVKSSGDKSQLWDVADWGKDLYRFINVANGTDFYLDVHPSNPPFMSPNTDPDVPEPGQHWLMTSVKDVNDGAYSTIFTNTKSTSVPATTTGGSAGSQASHASPGTTDSSRESGSRSTSDSSSESGSGSSSGGLSTGASAGIGVGVGLGALALALAGIFFFWRRRRMNQRRNNSAELGSGAGRHAANGHVASDHGSDKSQLQSMASAPGEMDSWGRHQPGYTHHELDATNRNPLGELQ